MGSFDITCCISDLTIGVGDKVRVLLLTENPYDDSTSVSNLHDVWFPRTFPVEAVYDDYGRVREAKPEFMTELWRDGFKRDLVESGWGDNLCHDVPVSKKMDFEYTMDACFEGRVKVVRDVGLKSPEPGSLLRKKAPSGVPTRKRLEKLLMANDAPIASRGMCDKGYIVSGVRHGEVRIRWSGTGESWDQDEKYLTKILPLMGEYATMIRTGRHGTRAEMIVCVKPGNKDFYGYLPKSKNKPLLVKSAMIREDVWQGLCDFGMGLDYGQNKVSRKTILDMGREYWKSCLKAAKAYVPYLKDEDPIDRLNHILYLGAHADKCPQAYYVGKDVIPFTVGLGSHFAAFLNKALTEKVSDDEVEYFIQMMSEFTIVMSNLYPIRYWWRPTYSAGPQWGEWRAHERALSLFRSIADREANEQERQDSDEDETED